MPSAIHANSWRCALPALGSDYCSWSVTGILQVGGAEVTSVNQQSHGREHAEPTLAEGNHVSRREFLKLAGIAGAALGAGAGLGGLLAACGGAEETTTTTAAATTTTAGATPTTAAPTTTSASAGVEMGAEVKVGFVSPITGPLAVFATADKYSLGLWMEAIGDGVIGDDGKKHPVSFDLRDSQSDSNRAAQVAGDLILNSQIDLMLVASTPDTVLPVVQQCETNGVPVFATTCPWQTFLGPNMESGYKWAYLTAFGGEDGVAVNLDLLGKIPSNKIVGMMFDNSADGNFFAGFYPPIIQGAGYTTVDGGRFQPGTEDYTAQISAFKKAGCELVTGILNPPDFTNFWKQVAQQGLKLKAASIQKALLFPQSAEALGEIGNGIMTELYWHPTFPWKSSLTGESCADLANNFESATGQQYTAALMQYVLGEMALYTIKNATDPKSKDALLAAIEKMKFDAIVGPIDFSAPLVDASKPGPGHKLKNVNGQGMGGGQWLTQGGKWTFDQVPVSKAAAPFMLDSTIQAPKPLAL